MYTIHMVRGMRVPVQNGVKWDMSAPEVGAMLGLTEVTPPSDPMKTQRLEAVIRERIMNTWFSGKITTDQKDAQMHGVYKQYH